MARIASEIKFTGPLGDLSAYTMKGVEGIILRRKGGASKKKILTSKSFELTRMHMLEFAGRARAAAWLRKGLTAMRLLADYNFTGSLNARMKPIQEMNGKGVGKRAITLSVNPKILEGFSLNKTYLFESVVRNSISFSLSRENLTARVEIPELIPGLTLVIPQRFAMFEIQAELCVIPDLFYNPVLNRYVPSHDDYSKFVRDIAHTSWHATGAGMPATTLEMAIKGLPPDNAYSLMLSIGIAFGEQQGNNQVKQIKHAGSAKIVGVV